MASLFRHLSYGLEGMVVTTPILPGLPDIAENIAVLFFSYFMNSMLLKQYFICWKHQCEKAGTYLTYSWFIILARTHAMETEYGRETVPKLAGFNAVTHLESPHQDNWPLNYIEIYVEEHEPELHGLSSWIIDFRWAISMAKTLICLERNSDCFLGPYWCHQDWAYK